MQRARRLTPLVIKQGATQSFGWPILRAGVRVNLTGWTVRGQVRAKASAAVVLHEWSTTIGNARTLNGLVIIDNFPDSIGWTWREGIYDLFATDPDDQVLFVAEGAALVQAAVTREP